MYDKCYFCLDQLPKLKKESTASFFVTFWRSRGTKEPAYITVRCVCIYEEFTFTYLRYCTLSPNNMGCLCWSVPKEEHRFVTFANFSQVKKSEETRILLDCDFDKIETILQQVKPAYHCSLIQLKCHSENFQTSLHSMHPFSFRRTKLTCWQTTTIILWQGKLSVLRESWTRLSE